MLSIVYDADVMMETCSCFTRKQSDELKEMETKKRGEGGKEHVSNVNEKEEEDGEEKEKV